VWLLVGCLGVAASACGSGGSASVGTETATSVAVQADVITFRPVLAVCAPATGAVDAPSSSSAPDATPPVPSDTAVMPTVEGPVNVVVPGPPPFIQDGSATCGTGVDVFPQVDESGATVESYEVGPVLVDASSLESVRASNVMGQWVVQPVFREGPDGIDRFNAAAAVCHTRSADCPTGQFAIVLDGAVISAPSINESSFQRDQIQISGNFTEASAQELADRVHQAISS
jgi:preprotein translocase subunit SecD